MSVNSKKTPKEMLATLKVELRTSPGTIIVARLEEPGVTKTGLYLPDTFDGAPAAQGIVVAVDDEPYCELGATVIYPKIKAFSFIWEGVPLDRIDEDDVIAEIREKKYEDEEEP